MESPIKTNAGNVPDVTAGLGSSRQRLVLMVGNLSSEQLARVKEAVANALGEVQCVTFSQPSSSSSSSSSPACGVPGEDGSFQQAGEQGVPIPPVNFLDGCNHHKPAMVQVHTGLESLCKKLQSVAKLESKVLKAVSAIAHYQKQQQDLADNFVRLSNKYQELKSNFHTVLWAYMPRLSEFSEIPILDTSLQESDTQVGQFAVGLLVGKGHFAEVKVCSLASDDRRLVIKAIDKQRVKNVNGLQRISHEIEALKILRHPNILTLYSVLHGKHFMYLVTERLSSDLYEFIGEHSNGVGEPLAKKIINPILDAVLFMHTKGFVHRDLKPENILLDYTGSAAMGDFIIKVCDFGLCEKITEEHAVLTEFCGSPGFMAPEMVIDRQYDGKKADLWSIGCILLELLLTAKEFSTIWMKNFQDEFLDDPMRFKRQLYGTWSQLEAILKAKASEDLFIFVSGLLRIDPTARLTSGDLHRTAATGGGPGMYRVVTTGKRDGSPSPLLLKSTSSVPPSFSSTSPAKPTFRHSESAPEHLTGGGPNNNNNNNNNHNHNSSTHHSSRLSPTPMAACHTGSLGASGPPPPSSSSPAPTTATATAKLVRPRPSQRHSSSARNSLRAQTLLKLESLSVSNNSTTSTASSSGSSSSQYIRGRNPGLGPLSPGTPDVGIAKKFFEEDQQQQQQGQQPQDAASQQQGGSSSNPGSPLHHLIKSTIVAPPPATIAHFLSSSSSSSSSRTATSSASSPVGSVTGAGVVHSSSVHHQQDTI